MEQSKKIFRQYLLGYVSIRFLLMILGSITPSILTRNNVAIMGPILIIPIVLMEMGMLVLTTSILHRGSGLSRECYGKSNMVYLLCAALFVVPAVFMLGSGYPHKDGETMQWTGGWEQVYTVCKWILWFLFGLWYLWVIGDLIKVLSYIM